jgi:hypothetical protein
MSVFFLCYGQGSGGTHFDGPLDIGPRVFGRFGVEDLHHTAFGNPKVVGRFEFTHGVPLAQIRVELYTVTSHD